jgi:hypothetical protein
MRLPGHRGAGRLVATIVVAVGILGACGGGPPSAAPSVAVATPLITPDPHLDDPTTADAVFLAMANAGLKLTANNADAGGAGTALVKRINATYLGWPLAVSQYQTTASLAKALAWADGGAPGQGEPPVAISGLNILIEWGPTTGAEPPELDTIRLDGLRAMASTLDALLSPLQAHAVVAVPGAGTSAAASDDPAATTESTPAP